MDEYIRALTDRISEVEADLSRVIHRHEQLVQAHEHLVTQVQRHLITLPFGKPTKRLVDFTVGDDDDGYTG